MGLHMVALTKLHLLTTTHSSSPLITALGIFILKVPFSIRHINRVYTNAFTASRLFLFRLGVIMFGEELEAYNGQRWERALRLVRERLINARRSWTTQIHEDSLHVATMVAL
ncbi:hypothetical protein IFM89_024151 [Coptis chinensis]|uniref:Uncharacterized protein n=1 Tax=Coptis chinensis TaxID=261450 RepID=A0A835IE85_9MAGN|nr:hypothetical protein IFM89_024151 [Coptis chinensis]